MLSSIWQGANYYIEVFSERYHDTLERKAEQIEKQYLFIDENLDHLLNQNWRELQSDVSDLDLNEGEYDTSDEYGDGSTQQSPSVAESNASNDSSKSQGMAFLES